MALALVTWFSGAAICILVGACAGAVFAADGGRVGSIIRGPKRLVCSSRGRNLPSPASVNRSGTTIRAVARPPKVPSPMRMFSSPRHALRFGVGSALFLGSFIEAKGGRLPAYEERIFRSVNGASDRLRVPVRAIMQAGTFATVPAVSAVALLTGRRRLAASLLASGTVAWLGAKAAKPLGEGRALRA